jgi:prevent-host-death family protein
MKTIDADDLQANITQVLYEVESGRTVGITRHGKIVAQIIPATQQQPLDRDTNGIWTQLLQIRQEISARWPKDISVEDAINDMRRDL